MKPAKSNFKTFLVELYPKNSVGAEIGVWTGKFTRQVMEIVRPSKYHLVDPWKFMPQYPNRWYGGSRAKSQKDMDKIYAEIQSEFGVLPNISIHRTTSEGAAQQFDTEYFDWVYIDGDHSYKMVKKDIKLYLPLIKKGGIISGDDWVQPGVMRAVRELLKEIKTRNSQWWATV